MILLITMCLVGITATFLIRFSNYNKSFAVLEARAEQIANIYSSMPKEIEPDLLYDPNKKQNKSYDAHFIRLLEEEELQLINSKGEIISEQISSQSEKKSVNSLDFKSVLKGENVRKQFERNGVTWQGVVVPLPKPKGDISAIYLSAPVSFNNEKTQQAYFFVCIIILGIAIVEWFVIYLLLKKLIRPMSQLAQAAIQIADGDYTPKLPDAQNIKEQELLQLIHSFKEMTLKLKALEQMRTDLLASVSHELRTPLTSIRGMVQAVNSRVVENEEADEFLQISLDETKRMQRMIDNLLDYSSLEAGVISNNPSIIHFSQLVKSIIQQLCKTPSFQHIKVVLHANDLEILGDEGQIKQVLINLMMNSAIAGATEISFTCTVEDTQILIDVKDNGTGIEQSEIPFIFEKYYRGNSKRKKKNGLGLGLSLCKLLVRVNGGDISLLTTSEKGSTFRLSLPNPK
ncbi:ATP-binding protein [Bacillus sp. 1P06AnD]|uniref:HAMP domain-containing sensor histidine kinase n=1 Tax=Bacillus sp. 1P06AnD TaxID=3132208 RepID=UPI0039A3CE74